MAEVFANKIRTTVASAYTAGSGTLVVASATGMPATGNFRVRLGNVAATILRVTARSGTTLTVDVEQDDGNAAIGDTVRLVNTAAAMLALKADAIAGSGGGGGLPWWPTIVPLDQSAWAWVNQGGAAVVQAGGIVFLTGPTQAGRNDRARVVTAPATPYVITALIAPFTRSNANGAWNGLVFRQSSTGKLVMFIRDNVAGHVQVIQETNETTNAGVSLDLTSPLPNGSLVWFRIADNGTNLIYSISFDGVNFIQLFSEARGAFFTGTGFPNQIGIVTGSQSSASLQELSVLSWVQT